MFGYCLNKRGCSIPSELMAGLGANFHGARSSLERGRRQAGGACRLTQKLYKPLEPQQTMSACLMLRAEVAQ